MRLPCMTLLILLITCCGCALGSRGGLRRLDAGGTMDVFRPPDVGGMIVTTVELAREGMIREIVVVPRATLLHLDVRVRTGPGKWDTVKTLDGRYSAPITVRTQTVGDAVRVVEKSPALRTRRGDFVAGTSPTIKTILVYGTIGRPPEM